MKGIFELIFKRLMLSVVTVLAISVLIFIGVEALPGDLAEAVLGQEATPESLAAFRRELKLDLPPHVRYVAWLGGFVRGELGNSLVSARPVAEMIGWRFANTIFLAAMAAVLPRCIGTRSLTRPFRSSP